MLMLEVVRVCELDSGELGEGICGVSASTPASLKVADVRGDMAGESANLAEDLLDQVLKCAGGGREPVGRVGLLLRRSCR
jgi:hypothetical protein